MKKFIATAAICMLPLSANAVEFTNPNAKYLYNQALEGNNATVNLLYAYVLQGNSDQAMIDAALAVSDEIDADDIPTPEVNVPKTTSNKQTTKTIKTHTTKELWTNGSYTAGGITANKYYTLDNNETWADPSYEHEWGVLTLQYEENSELDYVVVIKHKANPDVDKDYDWYEGWSCWW